MYYTFNSIAFKIKFLLTYLIFKENSLNNKFYAMKYRMFKLSHFRTKAGGMSVENISKSWINAEGSKYYLKSWKLIKILNIVKNSLKYRISFRE